MATLRELKKAVHQLGGKVVVGGYNSYDQSTQIDVEAPDGKQWIEGNCQVMLAFFFSYEKESRYESYEELIERIRYGLEPCNENQ